MTARIGKGTKAPAERKRYTADYSDWLDAGETIASVVFAVSPAGALSVDAYSIAAGNTSVVFFVAGGNDGETYRVLITVTTSGGQTKEDFVFFSVNDPA